MLGTELSILLKEAELSFIGTDKELDITNIQSLQDFASTQHFDWIINCAAYTAVDKAEDDKETCRLLNTDGPANIATVAKAHGSRLIHISTDYVFDGNGNKPYTEDDHTHPIGIYGLTKRDGENIIIKENPLSYIIRTAWLYGKYGNNFVHTMLKLIKEREKVSVVNDQRGSPTWAHDLSQIIISIINLTNKGKSIPFGIYHFTNEGVCTWYEFAKAIYDEGKTLGILSKSCEIKPCTSAEYPAKVKRPVYSVLDKSKIKNCLGIDIPEWKTSLIEYLKLTAEEK